MNARREGFSIIELIMVVVLVAIAAVAIGAAFANMSRSRTLSEDLQRAWQLAQECAEHIVGSARKPGNYAAVPAGATACDPIAQSAPYARAVNVVSIVGASGTICTGAGWACKRVTITVTRAGTNLATLEFMLINY